MSPTNTSSTELLQAVLDGGIRSINFFNGRLLTGEDLSKEQDANRQERKELGVAIGEGVAYGLEVSATPAVNQQVAPSLRITPGLAANRQGQTLKLPIMIDVSLLSSANAGSMPATSRAFSACQLLPANVAGQSVFLFTIAPATGSEGLAPVSGLGNTTGACNSRYLIEGVQFRLLPLMLSKDLLDDLDHLRNRLAYACFGTSDDRVKAFLNNPFAPPLTGYGLLDDLRPNQLTDCEVPLATLYWTAANGFEFVDLWSVRRRLTKPAADWQWPLLLSDRRRSEGEAMFLQFEDHLETLLTTIPFPKSVVATQYFRYLPPIGILPLASLESTQGFVYTTFFAQRSYHTPLFIEGAAVGDLFHTALAYPPIDLSTNELIWLYSVRENQGPPYLIFTSGHVLFQREARFNLSHWNYSNYV